MYLQKLLNSLKVQTDIEDKFEIIIINNNSQDDTEKVSKKFIADNPSLNIRYYVEMNQGLSYSRNLGIKESDGDYLVFIDDDAYAGTNYLKSINNFIKTNPRVVAFGGRIITYYESINEPKWLSKYLWGLVGHLDYGNEIRQFPANKYPPGGNMIIKKYIINKVGLFNVKLGRIGKIGYASEEKDFFERLRNKETKLYYLPDAVVYHYIPSSRLTKEYIKSQCYSIGASERIIAVEKGKPVLIKKFGEFFLKYLASFILAIVFLIKFEPLKSGYLIMVRHLILIGFLRQKKLV